jgi:glycosyltransferase involved in cell wall biosynthesis
MQAFTPDASSARLRVAWTGPVGDVRGGGAAPLGGLLLQGLLDQGAEVDIYTPDRPEQVPEAFREHPRVEVVSVENPWQWNRWYSKKRVVAFASSSLARSAVHGLLGLRMVQRHRRRPYACIFQFSQTELFTMGWLKRALPPIVVHPCTTAAGELRWHRREESYARKHETWLHHRFVRSFLTFRARVQRRELRKPTLIVGPSEVFNRHMCADYGIDPACTRVLRHPLNLDRFPERERPARPEQRVVLLYAARLSTRKGLELITELSNRLADDAEHVQIMVVGGPSMWSDYSPHLRDLNPAVANYAGSLGSDAMPALYQMVGAVLIPSHYEPGSLVAGEALASGLPIVASDEVGPAEVLDPDCCRVFPSGDIDAFEAAVRKLVAELREGAAPRIGAIARREAATVLSPERLGGVLYSILIEASGRHELAAAGEVEADGRPDLVSPAVR